MKRKKNNKRINRAIRDLSNYIALHKKLEIKLFIDKD